MKFFKKFFISFLLSFRELFIYNHKSLDFRAMVFAVVISANSKHGECEDIILKYLARRVYGDHEETRERLLYHSTQEFLNSVLHGQATTEDIILKIDQALKEQKRLFTKINISDLSEFLECEKSEEEQEYQLKILNFLENTSKLYNSKG